MTLRWGLLGTARVNRHLIPAIRSTGRSTIVAIGSRNTERAASYAREWSIPHHFGSYERLVAAPVHIVFNALPNSLHVPWTLASLAAGKHVLCEKPLALNAADVDQVIDASTRASRIVTEAFMYRTHAQTARILDCVRGGALGTIRSIETGFSYVQDRLDDVRLVPALGGGALWDVGCYPVSIAQLLNGSPTAVSGQCRQGPTGVDLEFTGTLAYASAVATRIVASFVAPYQMYLRVTGTTGVLHVQRPFRPGAREEMRLQRANGIECIEVRGHEPFVDEVRDLEDAVLGNCAPTLSLAESRQHAATLTALHDAARTGRTVYLSS